MCFATSCFCLEMRPLPSTRVTRFPGGTTNLSATPERAACPSHERPVGPVIPDLTTLGVSRVACVGFPCVYVLPPLPRRQRLGVVLLASSHPAVPAFPDSSCRVGLHIVLFEIPWGDGGDRRFGEHEVAYHSTLEATMQDVADQSLAPTAIGADLCAIFVSLN